MEVELAHVAGDVGGAVGVQQREEATDVHPGPGRGRGGGAGVAERARVLGEDGQAGVDLQQQREHVRGGGVGGAQLGERALREALVGGPVEVDDLLGSQLPERHTAGRHR